VDAAGAAAEAVILALRLDEGIARSEAEQGPLAPHVTWAIESGLLERTDRPDGERLHLTTGGRLLSNELFARLI
jgi:coproporphyrinogen III oxidase-like Fe-S oxidoreductase